MLPCLVFEDEHLLVANKPPGLNTHAPSPFSGEGLYDWLRHREPRWASLSILHRLDKETSGLIVFGKTPLANRSLTEQFTRRLVKKKYLLLTDRPLPTPALKVSSRLARIGDRYVSRTPGHGGELAETCFHRLEANRAELASPNPGAIVVQAEPLTGRTHQIRVHAADSGFPILGDTLYGGTPAARLCLHAAELSFTHPATGEPLQFAAPPDFNANPRLGLRAALVEPGLTTACRLVHGAGDGWPGWYVDRLGDYLLSQGETPLNSAQCGELQRLASRFSVRGSYHKILNRQVRKSDMAAASPRFVSGEAAPERFTVRENGLAFELSFAEGYSVGLFLDQRDNRRRLLTGHVAGGFSLRRQTEGRPLEILNLFAYTCAFSVAAAKTGARVTSLDLSRKYLDWGKRHFLLNELPPENHEFICGDVFEWLRRLGKKQRRFDVVLLDPPTFSQSKASGVFRAEKDYAKLVSAALPLLKAGGVLFASTNAATLAPEAFLAQIETVFEKAGRGILQRHYAPQPPDFPVSRQEPAYLKTVWLRAD